MFISFLLRRRRPLGCHLPPLLLLLLLLLLVLQLCQKRTFLLLAFALGKLEKVASSSWEAGDVGGLTVHDSAFLTTRGT